MTRTLTCPRCAHRLDTWVRERETTFCEVCGTPVVVPRGADHTDRAPPLDALHRRAALAGQLGWHWDHGRWVRRPAPPFPRGLAIALAALVLAVLGVVSGTSLAWRLLAEQSRVYPVDDLLVGPEHPEAPFADLEQLRRALSEEGTDGGWTLVPDGAGLRVRADRPGQRAFQERLASLRDQR